MPIYEYNCYIHGNFDVYLQKPEPPSFVICGNCNKNNCDIACKLQMSLCTMRPDSHWNGTVLPNGKLVNNSKEYKEETANWQTRTDATDAYTKQRRLEKKRETEAKIKKQTEEYAVQALSGVSLE